LLVEAKLMALAMRMGLEARKAKEKDSSMETALG
jgi:hypothetical protein